jgi:hypothetical protein
MPQIALHDKSPIDVINEAIISPGKGFSTWNYLQEKKKKAIILKQQNQT